MIIDPASRHHAADLIRRHFQGEVTLDDLVEDLHRSQDPLVRRALELVYQQPARGFLGVRPQHWDKVYWPRVLYILEQLDAGEAGVAPPAPLYPPATLLRTFGVFLMVLLVWALTAEAAWNLYRHVTGAEALSGFDLVKNIVYLGLFGFISVKGVGGLRYRIWLYRQWRSVPPIRFSA